MINIIIAFIVSIVFFVCSSFMIHRHLINLCNQLILWSFPDIKHSTDKNLIIKKLNKRFVNIQTKCEYLNKTHSVSATENKIMYFMEDGYQRILVLGDFDSAKSFYKDSSYRKITRIYPYLGYVFQKLLKSSLGAHSGQKWLIMKKPLSQFFTTRSLKSKYEMFFTKTENWIDRIFQTSHVVSVPLQEIGLDILTIDIIPNIIYGELTTEETKELLELSRLHNKVISIMGIDMFLRPSMIYNNFSSSNKKQVDLFFDRWVKFNVNVIDKIIQENRSDCLLKTMIMNDAYKDQEALFHTLYEVSLFNIDIMIDSFSNLIWNVATNPLVKQKLYEECKNINLFDVDELEKLKYLNKVVNESSRLNPGIVITFPETLTESIEINGFSIPSGTMISLDTQSINRDPKIWNNPHEFIPNRFDSDEKFHFYHRFGLGPRKCLGNIFGDYILKLGLVMLLQKSDIKIDSNAEKYDFRNTIPNLNQSVMSNIVTFTSRTKN